MTGSQKRKGDRAEREGAGLLTVLLKRPVIRLLGAGRAEDVGDLGGIDGWAIQVADWQDIAAVVRQKPVDAELQAIRSGTHYGAALIRLKGGEFRIVMTPQTWARWVTEQGPPYGETRPPFPPQQGPPLPPEKAPTTGPTFPPGQAPT